MRITSSGLPPHKVVQMWMHLLVIERCHCWERSDSRFIFQSVVVANSTVESASCISPLMVCVNLSIFLPFSFLPRFADHCGSALIGSRWGLHRFIHLQALGPVISTLQLQLLTACEKHYSFKHGFLSITERVETKQLEHPAPPAWDLQHKPTLIFLRGEIILQCNLK